MKILSIKLRSLARKMKIHHLIWNFRNRFNLDQNYEEQSHRALEENIKSGDVVWDIGANVGIYTELFCKWVGPDGQVVAFEPNPAAIEKIKERLPDSQWLTLQNVALGSREETSLLVVDADDTAGHVHYSTEANNPSQSRIPVQVMTVDSVRQKLGRAPNVMKIDVEGFEEEVLIGSEKTLSDSLVRALLIEVHFQELESRGQATAPVRIESFLRNKGFVLKWVDRNHLLAKRSA